MTCIQCGRAGASDMCARCRSVFVSIVGDALERHTETAIARLTDRAAAAAAVDRTIIDVLKKKAGIANDPHPTCAQRLDGDRRCEAAASHVYLWPGANWAPICPEHMEQAVGLAVSLGFSLPNRPIFSTGAEVPENTGPASEFPTPPKSDRFATADDDPGTELERVRGERDAAVAEVHRLRKVILDLVGAELEAWRKEGGEGG